MTGLEMASQPQLNGVPRITVLFVEDNRSVREATSMLLSLHGFDVFSAPGRVEALAHLQAGCSPNVILCDYRLVEDNGVRVVSCVRQQIGEDVPAVILTGDTTALRHAGGLPPRTELVHKPPRKGELALIIRALAGA